MEERFQQSNWQQGISYQSSLALNYLNTLNSLAFLMRFRSDSLSFLSRALHIDFPQQIGSLAAYPFSPYITDGLGRRPAIILGAVIMIGGTVLQTASQNVGMFIGARYVAIIALPRPRIDMLTTLRFLIGFGLTFAAAAAPLLVTEIAYPSQRAQATSMYNTLWYLGSIMWVCPSNQSSIVTNSALE